MGAQRILVNNECLLVGLFEERQLALYERQVYGLLQLLHLVLQNARTSRLLRQQELSENAFLEPMLHNGAAQPAANRMTSSRRLVTQPRLGRQLPTAILVFVEYIVVCLVQQIQGIVLFLHREVLFVNRQER